MATLLEAIEIKRKMFFEYDGAPYHCLDVEVSKPTARGGQTLVRLKMRNLLTRAVFDKTFKAGDKFGEPDLVVITAAFLYSDAAGYYFMDQESYETLTLSAETVGDDRELLVVKARAAQRRVWHQHLQIRLEGAALQTRRALRVHRFLDEQHRQT